MVPRARWAAAVVAPVRAHVLLRSCGDGADCHDVRLPAGRAVGIARPEEGNGIYKGRQPQGSDLSAQPRASTAYKPLLDELGVTYPQHLVRSALRDEDGRTVGSIAERLSLQSSTITPLVKRTQHRGGEWRARVSRTARGREPREKSRCLRDTRLERAGMAAPERLALDEARRRPREQLARGGKKLDRRCLHRAEGEVLERRA